jgi:hypothetical protein
MSTFHVVKGHGSETAEATEQRLATEIGDLAAQPAGAEQALSHVVPIVVQHQSHGSLPERTRLVDVADDAERLAHLGLGAGTRLWLPL